MTPQEGLRQVLDSFPDVGELLLGTGRVRSTIPVVDGGNDLPAGPVTLLKCYDGNLVLLL